MAPLPTPTSSTSSRDRVSAVGTRASLPRRGRGLDRDTGPTAALLETHIPSGRSATDVSLLPCGLRCSGRPVPSQRSRDIFNFGHNAMPCICCTQQQRPAQGHLLQEETGLCSLGGILSLENWAFGRVSGSKNGTKISADKGMMLLSE